MYSILAGDIALYEKYYIHESCFVSFVLLCFHWVFHFLRINKNAWYPTFWSWYYQSDCEHHARNCCYIHKPKLPCTCCLNHSCCHPRSLSYVKSFCQIYMLYKKNCKRFLSLSCTILSFRIEMPVYKPKENVSNYLLFIQKWYIIYVHLFLTDTKWYKNSTAKQTLYGWTIWLAVM